MKENIFKKRRDRLIEKLSILSDGRPIISLLNSYKEPSLGRFSSNTNFYYFTGLDIPDATLILYFDGKKGSESLFLPPPNPLKARWYGEELSSGSLDKSGRADSVKNRAIKVTGFKNLLPNYDLSEYLQRTLPSTDSILIDPYADEDTKELHSKILKKYPFLNAISGREAISSLRKSKDNFEIEKIKSAIDVAIEAEYAIMHFLRPDMFEYEIDAIVNYIFLKNNSRESFPSIIGSGKNSTILHYNKNDKKIDATNMVVCDIGARKDYYCSDLTRSFPANGVFSKKQLKLYEVVLEASEIAIKNVKTGVSISELNQLLKEFYEKKGLNDFNFHGVSHHLGLDVHEEGNLDEPLPENSVITIEPGLYDQKENIGIRIEDDVLVKNDGAQVLSKDLIKDTVQIEKQMAKRGKRVII